MKTSIPGPNNRLGARNVLRFASDALGLLRQMTDRYGDMVEMKILGTRWIIVNNPRDIEEAMVKRAAIMGRDEYVEILEHALGKGLLTSDGELWRRQRKLMAQAFTPKRIREYAATMSEVTDAGITWTDGEVINIHDEMSRVTMEVVARVLFGTGVARDDVELVRDSMEATAAYYANSPEALAKLPTWIPTPRNLQLRRAVKRIDALLYRIISDRRSGRERPPEGERLDLLGTLLAACDDEGVGMSDQQLRDEAITLFLAGHETTALALAHTLTLISTHPEVERRLVAELNEVLGGRRPEAADYKKLTYTEQVLKEGMRLYPPAWTTGRAVLEEMELGGYRIPAGAQLIFCQWVVHRDRRFYPDPEAFNPDRWTPEATRDLPRYAYFPFGGGPRVCIGNHFAMMEAVLILAVIMQRVHLELLPGQRLELVPSVTLRAKQGLRMRVATRPAAD